jgi:hypothetical protein
LLLCLVIAASLVFPETLEAVVAVDKTFRELVQQADTIVVGAVVDTQSLQLGDGPIVTDVYLDISMVLKGRAERRLVLRLLGGKVGDIEVRIEGAPTFRAGQEALLFVRGNFIEMLPFVGVQQGVFRLASGSSFEARGVLDWRGRPVVGIENDRVTIGDAGETSMTAGELVREILREMGR